MTIILVQNKQVLSMPALLRHVLKFIYDEKNMSVADIRLMQESVINWSKAIALENEKLQTIQAADLKVFGRKMTTEHKYTEEEIQLQAMAAMLRDNDEGKLNERKENFKKHNIDYRKFHRLPEAYTLEGLLQANKYLEDSNRREGIDNNIIINEN